MLYIVQNMSGNAAWAMNAEALTVILYDRAPHVGREADRGADRGADRDVPPPRERREEPAPRSRERERERERPANGHRESYKERDATPRCVYYLVTPSLDMLFVAGCSNPA